MIGLTGSTEEATNLLKELDDFANSTPFDTLDVQEQGRTLKAFGVESDNVVKILKQIGDVTAGTNTSLEENVRTYGKLLSQGKAGNEVLLQFADRGVPIYQQLAETLGVTIDQVKKLATENKISVEDFNAALEDATSGSGAFADQLEKQSATVKGRFSTLGSVVKSFGVDFGKALNESFDISGGLKRLTDFVSSLRQQFNQLGDGGQRAVIVFAGLAAAIGPILVAVGTLGPAIGVVLAGLKAVALTAAPIVAIGAAIAGVAAAAVSAAKESGLFGDIFELLSPLFEGVGKNIGSFRDITVIAFEGVSRAAQFLFKIVKVPFRILFAQISKITRGFAKFGSIGGKALSTVLSGFQAISGRDVSGTIATIDAVTGSLDTFIEKRKAAGDGIIDIILQTGADFSSIQTGVGEAAFSKIEGFFKDRPKKIAEQVQDSTEEIINAPAVIVDAAVDKASSKIDDVLLRINQGFTAFGEDLSGVTQEFASTTISQIGSALNDATDQGVIEALMSSRETYKKALSELEPIEPSSLDNLNGRIASGYESFGDDLGGVTEQFSKKTISQIESALADATDPEIIASLETSLAKYESAVENFKQNETELTGLIPDPKELGISALGDVFDEVSSGAKDLGESISDTVDSIISDLSSQAFRQLLSQLFSLGISGGVSGGASGGAPSIPGNRDGGLISGPGTGRSDSILSWISNGEFIFDDATRRFYGAEKLYAMQAMAHGKANASQIRLANIAANQGSSKPRYESGGLAGESGSIVMSPNIDFNVINQSSQDVTVDNVTAQQNGTDFIVTAVVKDLKRNGAIRQMINQTKGRR